MGFPPVSVVSSWWGEGTEMQKIQKWNRGGLLQSGKAQLVPEVNSEDLGKKIVNELLKVS